MLKKVLEKLKALTAEERRKLQAEIRALDNHSAKPMTEDELLHKMAAAGVLRLPSRPLPDIAPVPCTGKPVSETIVEERR